MFIKILKNLKMRGQLTALILPFVLWELYVQGGCCDGEVCFL